METSSPRSPARRKHRSSSKNLTHHQQERRNQLSRQQADGIVVKPMSNQTVLVPECAQTDKLSDFQDGCSGLNSKLTINLVAEYPAATPAEISQVSTPKKRTGGASSKTEVRAPNLAINVIDQQQRTRLESIQSVDESSVRNPRSDHNLTVRDGKVRIKSIRTPDSTRPDPRTAMDTREQKQSAQKVSGSGPNLRYVVKEEQSLSPSNYSRHSNEDLICFSRGFQVQTAQPTLDSSELTIMPAVLQMPVNGRSRARHHEAGVLPTTSCLKPRNELKKKRLEEHLLSPFETDSGSKPSIIPTQNGIDHFSISGEFEHHMEMENNHRNFEMQTISPNNSIYNKQENPNKYPADLTKVHELVTTGKATISKPAKIVGLPDIGICQGREPLTALNMKINPETARSMERSQIDQELQRAREEAVRASQPSPRSTRRKSAKKRSKSKKKKQMPLISNLLDKKEEEKKDDGLCYIQNVLSKYLFDYDEFKRRQKGQNLSQTIDVARSVELPPLKTPTGKRRVTLQDNINRYMTQAKEKAGLTKLSQTPRIAQSIDFSKYKRPDFDLAKVSQHQLSAEREGTQKDMSTINAIQLHFDVKKQDRQDANIFQSKKFKKVIDRLQGEQNKAMGDFKEYMDDRLSLDNSPFVPTHVTRQTRLRQNEETQKQNQERMLRLAQKEEKMKFSPIKHLEGRKNTRELAELLHNLNDDIQLDSLEKFMSVSDLATIGESKESAVSKDISRKDLEVDLSNFKISETRNGSNVRMMKTAEPREDDYSDSESQNFEFNLDPRLIDMSKALKEGEISIYQKLCKEVTLMPNGKKPIGAQLSEGAIPGELNGNKLDELETHQSDKDGEDDGGFQAEIEANMRERINQKIIEEAKSIEPNAVKDSLQTVKELNKRLKKANLTTLNELIDEFLSSNVKSDISPLLMVYDQVKQNTKLTLPSKALLEQDQKFFKKALTKLRRAQKIEIRWIKAEAMQAAHDYVNKKAHDISQIMTLEVRDMFRQYDEVREQATFMKRQNEKLTQLLVGYENKITELTNQMRNMHIQKHDDAQAIKLFDEDDFSCQVHSLTRPCSLKEHDLLNHLSAELGSDILKRPNSSALRGDGACALKGFAKLQSKYYEKVVNYQEHAKQKESLHIKSMWSKDGLMLPQKPKYISVAENMVPLMAGIQPIQINKHINVNRLSTKGLYAEDESQLSSYFDSSLLKTPSLRKHLSMSPDPLRRPSNKRQQSQGISQMQLNMQPIISESSSDYDLKSEKPAIEKLQNELRKDDPLLSNKFQFFNSSITLNLDDRVAILKDNTVNYYRGQMCKIEEYTGQIESESRFFKELSAKYHGKVIIGKEKIKELHKRIKHHIANFEMERLEQLNAEREKYKQLKADTSVTLQRCKQIFGLEVMVLEKLLERALQDNVEKTNLLRKFAFVLKVPRLHHEYIERNGVDQFIQKFTKIISENEALKAEMERIGENRRVRNAVSQVKAKMRINKETQFVKSLPMQVELLIRQRAKFMGRALDEAKITVQKFKPELEKKLQDKRKRQQALSKSMSVNRVGFQVERDDPFDASVSAASQSIFSSNRVNVVVPSLRQGSERALETSSPHGLYKVCSSQLLKGPVHERSRTIGLERNERVLSQEFIETMYMKDVKEQKGDKNTTNQSLKDLMNETIRKRSDYYPSKGKIKPSNHNLGTGLTQVQSSTNFIKDMSSKDTQSKTILHQAYLQALSQSSSMEEVIKKEISPNNILARSDANLTRTRQNFMSQYGMVNDYQEKIPSYKFALSSSLIESVDTVLKNNSEKKDYIFQSQNRLGDGGGTLGDHQPQVQMKQLLNKNYIIEQAREAEQKLWSRGNAIVPDASEEGTIISEDTEAQEGK